MLYLHPVGSKSIPKESVKQLVNLGYSYLIIIKLISQIQMSSKEDFSFSLDYRLCSWSEPAEFDPKLNMGGGGAERGSLPAPNFKMFLLNSDHKAALGNKIKKGLFVLFVFKSIGFLVCGDSVSSCSPNYGDYKKVTLGKPFN